MELSERLKRYSREDAISGCVEWVGYRDRDGYGRLNVNGATVSAHRVAYELANGPITNGLFVCHHCDNPTCINTEHLFLGNASDNMVDAIGKGRNHEKNKTHCKNGHPFSPENTYTDRHGWRYCRECRLTANAEYFAENREALCARQREYASKNKEREAARVAEWRRANPARCAEQLRSYRERNREKINRRERERQARNKQNGRTRTRGKRGDETTQTAKGDK